MELFTQPETAPQQNSATNKRGRSSNNRLQRKSGGSYRKYKAGEGHIKSSWRAV
jgi:hypothetical protein